MVGMRQKWLLAMFGWHIWEDSVKFMFPCIIHGIFCNSATDQCDQSASCLHGAHMSSEPERSCDVPFQVTVWTEILHETVLKTLFGPKHLRTCELGFSWFVYVYCICFLRPLSLILKWRSFLPVLFRVKSISSSCHSPTETFWFHEIKKNEGSSIHYKCPARSQMKVHWGGNSNTPVMTET